jgi:hypothetical protein
MQIGGQDTTFGGMRNRIINGNMTVDQRNAGASVTNTTANIYTIDRWACFGSQSSKFTVQQDAGAVTPPAGFTDYLGCTSTAATSVGSGDYFQINQVIEGYNIADLNWGTANAQPITISFWVRSSLTGTFGGALRNSALNRSYPFTYTINAANTWEKETITIPGDTSGTWLTTNGWGLQVVFSLGMGSTYSGTAGAWTGSNFASATGATNVVSTNAATFYITGVQLEKGSAASAFENRQFGQELALCQRYFYTTYTQGVSIGSASQPNARTSYAFDASSPTRAWFVNGAFPVTMRTTPTTTIYDQSTGASGYVREYSSAVQRAVSSINNSGQNGDQGMFGYMLLATNGSQIPQQFHLACTAEL